LTLSDGVQDVLGVLDVDSSFVGVVESLVVDGVDEVDWVGSESVDANDVMV